MCPTPGQRCAACLAEALCCSTLWVGQLKTSRTMQEDKCVKRHRMYECYNNVWANGCTYVRTSTNIVILRNMWFVLVRYVKQNVGRVSAQHPTRIPQPVFNQQKSETTLMGRGHVFRVWLQIRQVLIPDIPMHYMIQPAMNRPF